MDDRIRAAFDAVHAEEALKAKTMQTVTAELQRRRQRARYRARRWIPVAACLLLLLLGAGSYQLYFQPTAAISIEATPAVELEVNRLDLVISASGQNEAGTELVSHLELCHINYQQALEQILGSDGIRADLEEGEEPLSIAVVSSNQARCGALLEAIQVQTAGQRNIYCCGGSQADAQAAQAAGLSLGKYQASAQLRQLDPSLTAEEIQAMSMREIRARTAQLLGEDTQPAAGGGNGYGGGMGNGWRGGRGQ